MEGDWVYARLKEKPDYLRALQREAAIRFYLLKWAVSRDLCCPPDFFERYRKETGFNHPPDPKQLAINGLSEFGFQRLIESDAVLAWMLDRGPGYFGVNPRALLLENRGESNSIAVDDPIKLCFLTDWARSNGIRQPNETTDSTSQIPLPKNVDEAQWRGALQDLDLCRWILSKSPIFFGHITFSVVKAVLELVQLSGAAADLVRRQ